MSWLLLENVTAHILSHDGLSAGVTQEARHVICVKAVTLWFMLPV